MLNMASSREIWFEATGGITLPPEDEENGLRSPSPSLNPDAYERTPLLLQKKEPKALSQLLGKLKRELYSVVPAAEWLPEYLGLAPLHYFHDPDLPETEIAPWRTYLHGDVIAGITAGVMAVPQTMACGLQGSVIRLGASLTSITISTGPDATLASLPPVFGLYSTLVPVIVYVFLGTSRKMSLGPVAVNCMVLTSSLYPNVSHLPPSERLAAYLPLVYTTTLLTGFFCTLLGVLGLGSIAADMVSPSVLLGFSFGSEILIAFSQLEPLLGFSTGHEARYLIPQLRRTFAHLGETKPAALGVGAVSILLLATLGKSRYTSWIPRPLFVTILGTVYAFFAFDTPLAIPTVGEVPSGFPSLVVPSLSFESIRVCALPAAMLALLAFMQGMAVAHTWVDKKSQPLRPNQELIALGASHALSAFTQSMGATGSYARTSVNVASGAETQVSGLVKAGVVALALAFLTPPFRYIPDTSLAAIVAFSVIGLADPNAFGFLWRSKRADFWVALLTTLATVFGDTTYGLFAGIASSLLLVLLRTAYPPTAILGQVQVGPTVDPNSDGPRDSSDNFVFLDVARFPEAETHPRIVIFRFGSPLWFVNAGHFKTELRNAVAASLAGQIETLGKPILAAGKQSSRFKPVSAVVVVDLGSVSDIDASGVLALAWVRGSLKQTHGAEVLFAAARGPVRDVLLRATGGRVSGFPDLSKLTGISRMMGDEGGSLADLALSPSFDSELTAIEDELDNEVTTIQVDKSVPSASTSTINQGASTEEVVETSSLKPEHFFLTVRDAVETAHVILA